MSDNKNHRLIRLMERRGEPNPEVVEVLKAWTRDAEAGLLRGVALLGVKDDGTPIWTNKGDCSYAEICFLTDIMKAETMAEAMQYRCEYNPDPAE